MAFHFSRDTRVFMKFSVESTSTGASATDTLYEIPVLDGFSFSQATNTSEITLNEAADASLNSKRGRAMFNDSLAPVEWSFSTYIRPTTSAAANMWVSGGHAGSAKKFAVEGPLWGAMSGTTYDYAIGGDNGAVAVATWEPNVFDFENSNKVALGVFTLYFVLGATQSASATTFTTAADGATTVYQVDGCSVGSASIDFDIDGLAQVAWSGQGSLISEIGSLNTGTVATMGLVREGIDTTSNFVRQK